MSEDSHFHSNELQQRIASKARDDFTHFLIAYNNCKELKENIEHQEFLVDEAKAESRDCREDEKKLVELKRNWTKHVLAYTNLAQSMKTTLEFALQDVDDYDEKNRFRKYLNFLHNNQNPFEISSSSQKSPVHEPANIPGTSSRRPPFISRMPLPKSRIPAASQLPGPSSKIPASSRIPAASQLPGPSSRIPATSRPPTLLPKNVSATNTALKVQEDIKKHKLKAQHALEIRKKGSLGNLTRGVEIKQQPKLIPRAEVKERQEGHKVMLEALKSVGNFKKRASRPIPQSSFGTSADERAKEVGRLGIQHASEIQKKQLHRQREIGAEQLIRQQTGAAQKVSALANFLKVVDPDMPPEVRGIEERKEIEEFKAQLRKKLCRMYGEQRSLANYLSDESQRQKFVQMIEKEIKMIFNLTRVTMSGFRGLTFRNDEVANNKFIRKVADFFMKNPDPKHCMTDLKNLFKLMPLPKFKLEKTMIDEIESSQEALSPLAALKRPPSNILLRKSLRRSHVHSPSRSQPAQKPASPQTVADEVEQMEQIRENERISKRTIREKLDDFNSNFCQIFCKNHEKFRLLGFGVWKKAFYESMDDILDELKDYYESLPHTAGKKFEKESISRQFRGFLLNLYEATKSNPVTMDTCKQLVTDRLEASTEIGRMKKLRQSLTTFVDYVYQLIDPFVKEVESVTDVGGSTSLIQASPKSRLAKPFGSKTLSPKTPPTNTSLRPRTVPKSPASPRTPPRAMRPLTSPGLTPITGGKKKLTRVEELRKQETPARMRKPPQASSTPFSASKVQRYRPGENSEKSIVEQVQELANESEGRVKIVILDQSLFMGFSKAVNIWEEFKKNFCQVIRNSNNLNQTDVQTAVYNSLEELKLMFAETLFGNSHEAFRSEMRELDNDFENLQISEFVESIEDMRVDLNDCRKILDENFDLNDLPDDDASRKIAEFYKKVNDFQSKYTTMIKEEVIINQPGVSPSQTKAPKVVASKLKTSIRTTPEVAPKVVKMGRTKAARVPPPVPEGPPTISPFRYVEGAKIPRNIIESDILYVACQLTDVDPDDMPFAYDALTSTVIRIAKSFKRKSLSKRKALDAIALMFWNRRCVSIDFLNYFTYHSQNEFFEEIKFEDPETNGALRTTILNSRNMEKCEQDKSYGSRQLQDSMQLLNSFVGIFDGDVDEIANQLYLVKSGRAKIKHSIRALFGDVMISGFEKSNKGNDLLGVPTRINGVMRHELGAGYDRMLGGLPGANISGELIGDDMQLLYKRLAQQGQEVNHLAKSRLKGLKYVLQPTGLDRQTFWQARGADVPKWFPGFFTVFQDSFDLKPANQASHSSAFLHAWRTMAPMVDVN